METLDRWSAYERGESNPRARLSDQPTKLQIIFDEVWMELRANGTVNEPKYPDTMHGKIALRVMRYEIGRQVMGYADHHHMTDGEIAQAVVKRMSITYRFKPGVSVQKSITQ